jgi:hypothetical protein
MADELAINGERPHAVVIGAKQRIGRLVDLWLSSRVERSVPVPSHDEILPRLVDHVERA